MIDFTSTSAGIAQQAQCCARLLAAVVALAVRDAAAPFTKDEKRLRKNLSSEAATAIHFMFHPQGGLDAYCAWIGMSAEQVRRGLLRRDGPPAPKDEWLNDERRRIIRQRAVLSKLGNESVEEAFAELEIDQAARASEGTAVPVVRQRGRNYRRRALKPVAGRKGQGHQGA